MALSVLSLLQMPTSDGIGLFQSFQVVPIAVDSSIWGIVHQLLI